jgi:hypothetical protein
MAWGLGYNIILENDATRFPVLALQLAGVHGAP